MGGIVAIVGRPNVGKSTLFNRLIQKKDAIVDESSGVTRDRHYGKSDWNGKEFTVIDTGGYLKLGDDVFQKEIDKQVILAIEESDVILLPITSEAGYGSTAIEALSCAKPIIWFDSPVLRETMGALGIPIPMEDVDKLKDAMARLIENENERKAMGELGRKHAIAIHSWERIWRQYENALQSVKKT